MAQLVAHSFHSLRVASLNPALLPGSDPENLAGRYGFLELTVYTRECLRANTVKAPLTRAWVLRKIVLVGEMASVNSNPDLKSAGW